MSTESIISLVIVGLLIYLIVTQHVKLAKLLPGKAGDFLDDFKLNQSNQPVQAIDHAAIINAAANVVAAAQASPQVTASAPAPHVNTMIENMLGRTPQTDAILGSRLTANAGQGLAVNVNSPDVDWNVTSGYRSQPGQAGKPTVFRFTVSYPPTPVIFSVPFGEWCAAAKFIKAQVDNGEVHDMMVTAVAGTIPAFLPTPGPHTVSLTPDADCVLRLEWSHG